MSMTICFKFGRKVRNKLIKSLRNSKYYWGSIRYLEEYYQFPKNSSTFIFNHSIEIIISDTHGFMTFWQSAPKITFNEIVQILERHNCKPTEDFI